MDLMDEKSLKHYGIKGMRWGHRVEEIPVGRRPAGAPPTKSGAAGSATAKVAPTRHFKSEVQLEAKANAYHAQARRIAAHAQVDPVQLRAKYGPPTRQPASHEPEKHGMSTRKKVAIGAGVVGVVGAAAVGYGAYKYGPKGLAFGKGRVAEIMSKKGALKIGDAAKAENAFSKPSIFKLGRKAPAGLVKNEAEAAGKLGLGKTRVMAILKREENLAGLRKNDYKKLGLEKDAIDFGGRLSPLEFLRDRREMGGRALGEAVGEKVPGLPGTDRSKLRQLNETFNNSHLRAMMIPASEGVEMHWKEGVDLPKGSVLKRLSSVAETKVRPEGFYAVHRPEDVQSYKAILPTYWEGWGVGSAKAGGFLNHYQAQAPIKAPSGQESFSIFKHLIHKSDSFSHEFDFSGTHQLRKMNDSDLLHQFTQHASNDWVGETPHAAGLQYFKELRRRGYNAVIDFNDAGKLAKQPLRVIDSSAFKIVKNEPQGLDDFYSAAKTWSAALVHKLNVVKDFIMHHLEPQT